MPWIPNAQVSRNSTVPPSWFNVKDYGAVGDGTHDDASAISAAMTAATAAGGGTVYFPGAYSGTIYGVGTTITNPGGIEMHGTGRGTVIRAIGSFANAPVIDFNQAGIVFDARIRDIQIDCNSKTGSTGLRMDNCQEGCLVENILVVNWTANGVLVQNVSDNFILRTIGVSTPSGATSGAAMHLNACPGYILVEDISLGGAGGTVTTGLLIEDCTLVGVRGGHFEALTNGILVDNSVVFLDTINGGTPVTNLISTTSTTTWTVANVLKGSATHTLVDGVNARTYDDAYLAYMAFGDYKYANWSGMTVTNPVTNRSLDVTNATLGDVRQVLGTLIADLKTIGLIDAS